MEFGVKKKVYRVATRYTQKKVAFDKKNHFQILVGASFLPFRPALQYLMQMPHLALEWMSSSKRRGTGVPTQVPRCSSARIEFISSVVALFCVDQLAHIVPVRPTHWRMPRSNLFFPYFTYLNMDPTPNERGSNKQREIE